MKILITGGLGNLGSWLTNHFLNQGCSVTVISRSERNLIINKNYKFIEADITNIDDLKKGINSYYDVCIHAASYNEHSEDGYAKKALLINSLGTELLCQALSINGVGKLIYLSTIHVYGSSLETIDENSYTRPSNDYGLTHFFAEKYIEKNARNKSLNYVILRLSNSYGCPTFLNSNKWYLLFNDLCFQAVKNQHIILKGNGKSFRDFIWMGDVINVVEKIIDNKAIINDCFNLTSGNILSTIEVAEIVKKAFNESFKKDVKILINNNGDKTVEKKMTYSNKKILSVLDYVFVNKMKDESIKIFNMIKK